MYHYFNSLEKLACKLFLTLLFVNINFFTYSQNGSMEYGDIKAGDFNVKRAGIDTTADAIILHNNGSVRFRVNNEADDFDYVYTRTTRILILNKKGLDWANHKLWLYVSGVNTEKVMDLKAATYNLVNGEVVREKMKGSAVFEEQFNKNNKTQSFTLPNVSVGSIIEFNYTLYSPFIYNLPNWQFQYEIPVLYSEFSILVPEFFNYKYTTRGYLPVDLPTEDPYQETFVFKYTTMASHSGLGERISYPVDSRSIWRKFVMKDVPGFRAEAWANDDINYLSAITFELESITIPNTPIKAYNTNWETLVKRLLEDDDFGRQLKNSRFLSEEVELIKALNATPAQLMNLVAARLKAKVKWNGKSGFYPGKSLKSVYNEGFGNESAINMLYVLFLRELGITADPVVLSTRSNGLLLHGVAKLSQLDYVIARILIGDKVYLADISRETYPPGILPDEAINGFGVVVTPGPEQTIDLSTGTSSAFSKNVSLSFTEYGKLSGTVNEKYIKQAAAKMRAKIKADSPDKLLASLHETFPGCEYANYSVVNEDSLYQPLLVNYTVEIEENAETDLIIIDPFILSAERENPFKLDERKYPVDFICPQEETYMFNLAIPQGFKVAEKPVSENMFSPDKSAQLNFSCTELNGTLQIICKVKYTRAVFVPEEYGDIKEFSKQVSLKKAQKLILQKI